MADKAKLSKSVLAATTLIMISTLAACSKGTSRPEGWTDAEITKAKCSSPRRFDMSVVNTMRLHKMSQSQLIVVRTILLSDDIQDKSGKVIEQKAADPSTLLSLPVQISSTELDAALDDSSQSTDAIKIVNVDCKALTATLVGPIVNQIPVSIKSVTISSITLVTADKRAEIVVKKDNSAAAVVADANGFNTVNMTITEKQDDGSKRVRVLQQQSTLNNSDAEVQVSRSLIEASLAAISEASAADANISDIKAKLAATNSITNKTVPMKFAELIAIRDAARAPMILKQSGTAEKVKNVPPVVDASTLKNDPDVKTAQPAELQTAQAVVAEGKKEDAATANAAPAEDKKLEDEAKAKVEPTTSPAAPAEPRTADSTIPPMPDPAATPNDPAVKP
jgi:hypothetical protein